MMDDHIPASWSGDDEPVDTLPLLHAQIDQVVSTAPQWARIVRARYEALTAEGFEPQQALYFLAIEMSSNPDPVET